MISLDIDTCIDGRGLARLGIAGEIDRDSAGQVTPAVVKVLDGDSVSTIQVDFSGVTFMDSAGIRALLTAQRIAGERGVTLYVTAAHDYVLEVLEMMGLVDILIGPPTEESASQRGG